MTLSMSRIHLDIGSGSLDSFHTPPLERVCDAYSVETTDNICWAVQLLNIDNLSYLDVVWEMGLVPSDDEVVSPTSKVDLGRILMYQKMYRGVTPSSPDDGNRYCLESDGVVTVRTGDRFIIVSIADDYHINFMSAYQCWTLDCLGEINSIYQECDSKVFIIVAHRPLATLRGVVELVSPIDPLMYIKELGVPGRARAKWHLTLEVSFSWVEEVDLVWGSMVTEVEGEIGVDLVKLLMLKV